jgi:oxygen-independent coproporphyrinogen-3 oxidase
VGAAREAGFDNISLDLIYGLPDQMVASWEHTLTEAIALGPDHISAYGLTLEPGTPLEADVRAGRVPEPDNDIAGAMYDVALGVLSKAGYQQYEISNWAKPGRESIHNLAYWRSTPYLGVGPGAHSYLWPSGPTTLSGMPPAGVRFATFRSPRDYIERAKGWTPAQSSDVMAVLADAPTIEDREELTQAAAVADVLMMGLRLNAGMADTEFKRRFGEGIAERVPGAVEECLGLGLVEWESGRLRLTDRGRPVANEAFERFVSAAREPA